MRATCATTVLWLALGNRVGVFFGVFVGVMVGSIASVGNGVSADVQAVIRISKANHILAISYSSLASSSLLSSVLISFPLSSSDELIVSTGENRFGLVISLILLSISSDIFGI